MRKRKILKFKSIYEKIPEEKQEMAQDLIEKAEFLEFTLTDLKEKINETGTVDLFVQGKQKFVRENPALRSYNTTTKQYLSVCKQILDLMPKTETQSADDGFDDFITGRYD